MQKKISIRLLPSEVADHTLFHTAIATACGIPASELEGARIDRQSIDSRGRTTYLQLNVTAFINEPFQEIEIHRPKLRNVSRANTRVVIVGAGPAGLFAALRLIELGIRPIIIERGKDIRSRRRDLAAINKQGIVNPESNYCFGEGGAGTYSDGKLYTRSSKRGDIFRILSFLVHYGATPRILYEAHPHIGTNKLPGIITAIRESIIECGGEVLFDKKLIDIETSNNKMVAALTHDNDRIEADALVLATGHSARDVFELLQKKNILIEAKPFALGVRIEHPQSLIDTIQYHCPTQSEFLPPAAYSVVEQVNGTGVFSFCMCPGGIIAPAATAPGEIVVNGWSPSKRNNPFANSGIVVSVDEKDWASGFGTGALSAMHFQSSVEMKAFDIGAGALQAPAQRMMDFCTGKVSGSLPECSYLPGVHSAQLSNVLPPFVHRSLQAAFREFGKKMKGYLTNEAIVVATESRTSSPVRIPRHPETLEHPQIGGLYPCGEGAGYAGGIVSAAMDGERIADAIARKFL